MPDAVIDLAQTIMAIWPMVPAKDFEVSNTSIANLAFGL